MTNSESRKEIDMVEPYYYSRYHDGGPGAWCVRGPNGFCMHLPELDKSEAYAIGKILSHEYADAQEVLNGLIRLKS